ncbi:MAG: hypothetical protein ACJ79K_17395 [Gemmatimonadaceae bacterium]
MSIDLKPRSGVELIDASFQFLRENFALLFTTTAVTYTPIALAEYLAARDPASVGPVLVARLVTWVFASMAQAATIEIVATRYVGESITPADALRAVWKRLGTALAITFLYGLLIGIGTVFFIVPGIYFATKYFAAMAAAMIEGKASTPAFERSGQLTDGSKWRLFRIFALTLLIYFALVGASAGIAGTLMSPPTASLVARLLMAITNPFLFTLVTLTYFDLRIRREGLDLDFLMTPAPAPTAAAPVVG